MKKWFVLALVLVLLAGAAWGGHCWYHDTYITIDGARLRRDATELDLSGAAVEELEKLPELTMLKSLDLRGTGLTAAEYENLRAALPGCRILWSVPFQNRYLEEAVTEITVTELEEADLEMLKYLPELTAVDALDCRDYEALALLMEQRPELEVAYQVPVAGKLWGKHTQQMTLDWNYAEELAQYLPYLKELQTVTFTGENPDSELLFGLKEKAPGVNFIWEVTLLGLTVSNQTDTLILSGIPMESVEEVENSLKFFPNLSRVEMCGCGIPSAEMDALGKRHPEIRFVWTVRVGRCELRTDATTFMPWKWGYTLWSPMGDVCEDLKYCTDMVCMDLGHMVVSDYSFLEYMPKMKYLVLAETRGKDFSVLAKLKELVFLELFLTDFDQLEVLKGLTKLEDLNICYTKVSDITPLLEMTWLKRLWMVGVHTTYQDQLALKEALPEARFAFRGKGSTEGAWRLSPNYKAMRDLLEMPYMYG